MSHRSFSRAGSESPSTRTNICASAARRHRGKTNYHAGPAAIARFTGILLLQVGQLGKGSNAPPATFCRAHIPDVGFTPDSEVFEPHHPGLSGFPETAWQVVKRLPAFLASTSARRGTSYGRDHYGMRGAPDDLRPLAACPLPMRRLKRTRHNDVRLRRC